MHSLAHFTTHKRHPLNCIFSVWVEPTVNAISTPSPQTGELLNSFLGSHSKEQRTERVIRCLVTPTSQHPLLSQLHMSPLAPHPSLFLKDPPLLESSQDFFPCHLWENSPFVALTMLFFRGHSDQPNPTSNQEVPGHPPPVLA